MLERERLLAQSRASNTHSTYLKAWESFQNFRLTYKFSFNEAPTIEHLVNYIAYLSLNGYAAATLFTYIAGLSFRFRSHGLQDVTQSFIVKRMLEGSRRGRITRDVRCPITMPTLKRLLFALPHVCISAYEVLLFRAAFLIAFSIIIIIIIIITILI